MDAGGVGSGNFWYMYNIKHGQLSESKSNFSLKADSIFMLIWLFMENFTI